MKTWVKLYTEIVDDYKLAGESVELIGWWALLVALAGKIDNRDGDEAETGRMDTIDAIAWHLRKPVETLQSAVDRFCELGMVHFDGDVLCLTHYSERQARRPSARPSAVRERVTQHRARKQAELCNADVTQVERVPDKSRVDREKIEIETHMPQNVADPPPPPKYDHKTPLHLQEDKTPVAIRAFREASGIAGPSPRSAAWREIVKTVVDAPDDLRRWADAVREWSLRGFKMTNVAGMLDWYVRGIPPRGSPREVQQQMDADKAEEERAACLKRKLEEYQKRPKYD